MQLVSTTLTNLDITACPLSSLGFLNKLPNLELLTLAECPNLLKEDFDALRICTQIVYLSVGFTRITSQKLIMRGILAWGSPSDKLFLQSCRNINLRDIIFLD